MKKILVILLFCLAMTGCYKNSNYQITKESKERSPIEMDFDSSNTKTLFAADLFQFISNDGSCCFVPTKNLLDITITKDHTHLILNILGGPNRLSYTGQYLISSYDITAIAGQSVITFNCGEWEKL